MLRNAKMFTIRRLSGVIMTVVCVCTLDSDEFNVVSGICCVTADCLLRTMA